MSQYVTEPNALNRKHIGDIRLVCIFIHQWNKRITDVLDLSLIKSIAFLRSDLKFVMCHETAIVCAHMYITVMYLLQKTHRIKQPFYSRSSFGQTWICLLNLVNTSDTVRRMKLIIFIWSSSWVIVDWHMLACEGEKERNNNRIFSISASCLVRPCYKRINHTSYSFQFHFVLFLSPFPYSYLFKCLCLIRSIVWFLFTSFFVCSANRKLPHRPSLPIFWVSDGSTRIHWPHTNISNNQ